MDEAQSVLWATIPALFGAVVIGPMVILPNVIAAPGDVVYVGPVEGSPEFLVYGAVPLTLDA